MPQIIKHVFRVDQCKTEVLLYINMQSKMVEVGLGPFQKMIEIRLQDKRNTKEQLFLNKYLFSYQCLCECRPWTCLEPAAPEEMSDHRKLDYV